VNYQSITLIEKFATYNVGDSCYSYQAEVANVILHLIERFARYEEKPKRQKAHGDSSRRPRLCVNQGAV